MRRERAATVVILAAVIVGAAIAGVMFVRGPTGSTINGWAIGDPLDAATGHDQESLYRKLEGTVLPLYYENRSAWLAVMKGAITKSASYFNSHRMMRRYVSEAYLR